MKIDNNKKIALVNPWTKAITEIEMSWTDIRVWCKINIHASDHQRWLRAARKAYLAGNGDILGAMIIGS